MSPQTADTTEDSAAVLHRELRRGGHCIVFAESCTAGLIAATLGRIPGISEWLAGSAVVYQLSTKACWLNVDEAALKDPGPVSQVVSEQMAIGVLKKTPHATIAASVTGHLGPEAPEELDGVAWTSVALRRDKSISVMSCRLQLDEQVPAEVVHSDSVTDAGLERRHRRQRQAVRCVLEFCVACLREQGETAESAE
ncbi:MAG: CinA family protein [Fuerstiella sp.]